MPRIEGVRVWGVGGGPRTVEVDGDGPRAIDGRGAWLVPSFVDLGCDPGFPGFPTREDAASLGAAALAGGFGDLVTHPAQDPVLDTPENFTDLQRLLPGGCRVHPLAAQTRGLAGTALSEAGLLQRAGVVGLSDGGRPVADTVVLRNALEYARGFGITTWLRPAEPSLDGLGVVNESAVAARMGLRGNPAATEEIGVARIVALVRATGAAVHLWPLGTARAVDMVRFARAEGLPITASVAARSLVLDENALDDGAYNTDLRLHPPLRTEADRLALVRGVAERTLLVCADHASRAPEEKELEFERAVPGATGLETAFAATMTALGDLDGVVEALALGPRRLLGLLPTGARVRLADVTGLALVAPEEDALVMPETLRSRARNEPLARRRLRGVVRATFPGARYAAPHE